MYTHTYIVHVYLFLGSYSCSLAGRVESSDDLLHLQPLPKVGEALLSLHLLAAAGVWEDLLVQPCGGDHSTKLKGRKEGGKEGRKLHVREGVVTLCNSWYN